MAKSDTNKEIAALKIHQWLKAWDKIDYSPKEHRKKPAPHFYIFSLSAQELRRLSGISRRQATKVSSRAAELGIQRQHDAERSEEINRFVEFGFPWSTLSERKRKTDEFRDLRKPGWLPTAIVVNVIEKGDERRGAKVAPNDLIQVKDGAGVSRFVLPYPREKSGWEPASVPPLEVIDGQHRLWAFGADGNAPDFEVPVVAFVGLDISWQAYLFYTINIKPKRINSSLAFDLYPLLRTEDWLEKGEGHSVYRETRSQELTEALWSNEASPWYDKINMLGERKVGWVTQNAWINTLMATLVRPWEGKGTKMGGLFGSRLSDTGEVLGWSRAQQAAFLIYSWAALRSAIKDTNKSWAVKLRQEEKVKPKLAKDADDAAFYGPFSMVASDQGVRGYTHVLNDLCFLAASKLKLDEWELDKQASASDTKAVSVALKSIAKEPIGDFVGAIADGLATFDWRTSSAPDLTPEERREKLVYRGSSGYKELRVLLLEHLHSRPGEVGRIAKRLSDLS